MKEIAIEDIATVFVSEFVKEFKEYLEKQALYDITMDTYGTYIPFLKMNYARRRKLVEKVLDKMMPIKGKEEK